MKRPSHLIVSLVLSLSLALLQPLVLDGRLDEESWNKADVIENFLQRDPEEGMPASEQTEVRVLYDQENLYFGVRCFESRAAV